MKDTMELFISMMIWKMLQIDQPEVFVLATGRTITVKEFIEKCCKSIDIDIYWTGEGIDEIGCDKKNGNTIIKINPEFYRPAEVELLIGNPDKAKNKLDWVAKTSIEELSAMMMEADLKRS